MLCILIGMNLFLVYFRRCYSAPQKTTDHTPYVQLDSSRRQWCWASLQPGGNGCHHRDKPVLHPATANDFHQSRLFVHHSGKRQHWHCCWHGDGTAIPRKLS